MKIVIIGTSGSGKTTLAKYLARELELSHIELDQIYWQPNWGRPDREVFAKEVDNITAGGDWVLDGNYNSVQPIVWPKADILVWLNYPISKVLWRACKRILTDWIQKRDHVPGCKASLFRELVPGKNGLISWILKSHWRRKREYTSFRSNNPYNGNRLLVVRNDEEKDKLIVELKS